MYLKTYVFQFPYCTEVVQYVSRDPGATPETLRGVTTRPVIILNLETLSQITETEEVSSVRFEKEGYDG